MLKSNVQKFTAVNSTRIILRQNCKVYLMPAIMMTAYISTVGVGAQLNIIAIILSCSVMACGRANHHITRNIHSTPVYRMCCCW